MRLPAALVAPLLLLAGCGGGGGQGDGAPAAAATASADPSAVAVGPVCREVRAGIEAFNQADFASTVAHFKTAVPLAEKAARSDPSRTAADLLEAVRYYAALAPDDYPTAAQGSSKFARYKAITLGQCEAPGGEPSDDGTPAQTA